MADNLPNVNLPSNVWVDLYEVTGLAVGTKLQVENVGTCDAYLAVQAAQPEPDHNSYNIVRREGLPLVNTSGDSGAWAFCQNAIGKLSVRSV